MKPIGMWLVWGTLLAGLGTGSGTGKVWAEDDVSAPAPLVVAVVPATAGPVTPAEVDALIAGLKAPGTPEEITALTQVFIRVGEADQARILLAVGNSGMINGLPLAIAQVNNEESSIALAALATCQRLGVSRSEDFLVIQRVLQGTDPEVQTRAALILVALGDESSLGALIARIGKSSTEETRSTMGMLVQFSGKDLGDTREAWIAWHQASLRTTDATLADVTRDLTNKDPEVQIEALKVAASLRLRRAVVAPLVAPLLDSEAPQVGQITELCLKALGGPIAAATFHQWELAHPDRQIKSALSPAIVKRFQAPPVVIGMHLSSGMKDALVLSGLIVVFLGVVLYLGRNTKVVKKLDEVTGGHATRSFRAIGNQATKQYRKIGQHATRQYKKIQKDAASTVKGATARITRDMVRSGDMRRIREAQTKMQRDST